MRRGVVLIPALVAALALGMFRELPSARAEVARGAGAQTNSTARGSVARLSAEAAPGEDPALVPLEVPRSIGPREPPRGWPAPPALSSPSYLLVAADTGQALASKDADLRRPVASTVKVLTALSVLRRASLDQMLTVGEEVRGLPSDAAAVGVEPGEAWTVGDLLEGLIARSGNDAALALAVGVGGTVEGFVNLMAGDAATLGLDGVALYEPAGLGDRNRLSARDLADITRAAMTDPRFVALVTQRLVDLPGVGSIQSRNRLLREYPGALGVKTGFTAISGRCLVAAAERDGRRLLAVVLGSTLPEGHFADAKTLLDFGFANFASVPVAGADPKVELRLPGRWVALDAAPTSLFVPASEPVLALAVQPPVEATPELATTLEVRWRGVELGSLQLSGEAPRVSNPAGAAAVGGWM
ncbi:MAG: D-alanyl-D-alanine carboxypeptidase, partial [Actinomycetota bacterium]|nr:D-alanyl-D-alanine carboxypeptidase [Actinomycetota bacterium]